MADLPSDSAIAEALSAAGSAHHEYEQTALKGVRDELWAGFYAAFVIGRLGDFMAASRLAAVLEEVDAPSNWSAAAAEHVTTTLRAQSDAMAPTVADVSDRRRFEIEVDGAVLGFAEYRRRPGVITFLHTEIDPVHKGEGLGTLLVKAALDTARAEGLAVLPYCPFFRGFIDRHREYLDLVPVERRAKFALDLRRLMIRSPTPMRCRRAAVTVGASASRFSSWMRRLSASAISVVSHTSRASLPASVSAR